MCIDRVTRRFRTGTTVDLVLFSLWENTIRVLTVERAKPPFESWPALPGGFVEADEDPRDAVVRETAEETGLDVSQVLISRLGVYSTPGRDPRGEVVSTSYVAVVDGLPALEAGSDAKAARWSPVTQVLDTLAFDHGAIVTDALVWLRGGAMRASRGTSSRLG